MLTVGCDGAGAGNNGGASAAGGSGGVGTGGSAGGSAAGGAACSSFAWPSTSPTPVQPEPGSWYRYAPSVIVDEGEVTRVWACGNVDEGVVRDHILYAERGAIGPFTPWVEVFGPAPAGSWDSFHTCDPAVVAGAFHFQGRTYDYALFYSGNDIDSVNHVQLGVALSQSLEGGGQWIRTGGPLISHPDDGNWGVGQPSVVSIDEAGRVMLLYTRAAPVPHVYAREVDLSDAEAPTLGDEVQLSEAAVVGTDGLADVLTNVDSVVDERRDVLLLLTERHPLPSDPPVGLATSLGIYEMDRATALSGSGTWQSVTTLDESVSGFSRNHNAGFAHRPSGPAPDPDEVSVFFSNSCDGCAYPAALWAVRLLQLPLGRTCR